MNVDIRIMGVETRIDNIKMNQEILGVPDENIFIDYDRNGVKWNAKRAWSKETDATHVLVLQDDVILCKDFMHYCKMIVERYPDDIISFFPHQFRELKDLRIYPVSPYVYVHHVSGVATMMRTEYIKPCLDSWRDDISGDDVNITEWAKSQGINIMSTIPALVQHIGLESVYDPSRSIGGTVFYEEDPSSAKWELDYVNGYANLQKGGIK